MRRLVLAAVLPLAACSRGEAPAVAEGGEHADCALGEGAAFAPVCAVERSEQDGEQVLVVRHPDGAFRRFSVLQDGSGVALSDGAETARVAAGDDQLEVRVGPDRYRFPFKVRAGAAQ